MSEKIVFMGTPDFAVESLKQLIENGENVVGVITSPDRPAGRGQQLRESAVKQFAVLHKIPLLQPEKLKAEEFITALREINADLFVVVAFRMLPEIVWAMPAKGTINLHGSLLPKYRGAAPINWAVINGDKETGATTFFIEKKIDTGKIIDNVKILIGEEDSAGTIHDKLMVAGATLLTKTVRQIFNGTAKAKDQADLLSESELKYAPKIFKPDCKINWDDTTRNIYNKIRGLSPYPAAWTALQPTEGKIKSLKIFQTKPIIDGINHVGDIAVKEEGLCFGTKDGWLKIEELQLEGKKRMPIEQFIQGFKFDTFSLVIH
ncbi:MAG: methionyl-tRNA formyltransferase [Crocinitomix sp.]|nr:methionyl-tRNA formyltransferase [Crocinitomix sp.]